ncbi:MAG TPA: penicillin acylase family protein [Azospirillaceae bacterium]|nr:penicillin acylase family protein [Azospirillaceae bacterium]
MPRQRFAPRRSAGARLLRWAGGILGVLLLLLVVAAGALYLHMRASLPRLEGTLDVAGLGAEVTVVRDADGVPTLTSTDRTALVFALGYLHGQERFFQMDLLRRRAAGELGALVGPAALALDRPARLHRFRARAGRLAAAAPEEDKRLLKAYADGINAGLDDLGAAPFEYLALRRSPEPWRAEDSLLTLVAMYFDLQESEGWDERRRQLAIDALGPEMAAFLYPLGTDWDTPLDGTRLPEPALPGPGAVPAPRKAAAWAPGQEEPALAVGSNSWAVGGALTGSGAGMLANDMHLGIRVPNTWYRVRLVLKGADGDAEVDVTGVTLPGAPTVVAGSNGRVAWGYTNSYIDTGDVVVLEPAEGDAGRYLTPEGAKALERVEEQLCSGGEACETLVVEESVWGPVVATDAQGRKLAYRWVAHEIRPDTVSTMLALERAGTVAEAVGIAHRSGIPNQNFTVVDADGALAWTIIGRIPKRFGHDGLTPASWADGARGWDGFLAPEEYPLVLNPDGARIWTANSRMMGEAALAKLGFGGYALGSRARQIRDGLQARQTFAEADLLAIQLDDRATLLDFWQERLLAELKARAASDPDLSAMVRPVENWGGRATVDSVGYRLVRAYRAAFINGVYRAHAAAVAEAAGAGSRGARRLVSEQAEQPARRLAAERPAHLVPPGHADWDAFTAAVLAEVEEDVAKAGGLSAYSWGNRNRAGIRHPLTEAVPQLAGLLNPPDEPIAGDAYQPRVAGPGFGASERLVVAPGREAEGIFHMPTGQSGHPLSGYYMRGHEAWVAGRPAPFLPGQPAWTLTLRPGT